MLKAVKPTCVEFIMNDGEADHSAHINNLLAACQRFTCIAAFASYAGFSLIKEDLTKALKRGIQARFVFGLDFYQTDPFLLRTIFKLSRSNKNIELFISHRAAKYTFHPKVYVFEGKSQTDVVLGSANMTRGGLETNHEISMLARGAGANFGKSVDGFIQSWIDEHEIVVAEEDHIRDYSNKHEIYKAQRALANFRAKRQIAHMKLKKGHAQQKGESIAFDTLAGYLNEMKRNITKDDFDTLIGRRLVAHKKSKQMLSQIAKGPPLKKTEFLKQYEALIETWHSGGLHRGKTRIAKQSKEFCKAVSDLDELHTKSTSNAFCELLDRLGEIKGAGTNVVTEILHTLDNEKFAVMNQNSVYGVSLAYGHEFPDRPDKNNIDGSVYERFCKRADSIRIGLNLSNFSELDALFNYIYWLQENAE